MFYLIKIFLKIQFEYNQFFSLIYDKDGGIQKTMLSNFDCSAYNKVIPILMNNSQDN
jgi:hypothetical protein